MNWLEEIRTANGMSQKEVAEALYTELLLYAGRFRYVPLSTNRSKKNAEKNTRWKVDINLTIETDEI